MSRPGAQASILNLHGETLIGKRRRAWLRDAAYVRDWLGPDVVLNYVYVNRRFLGNNPDECIPGEVESVLRDGSCPDQDGCFLDEIRRTGGDFFFACDVGWQNEILDNHLGVLGHQLRFHVEDPPADGTLEVLVDGVEISAGPNTWAYDERFRLVVFTEDAKPTSEQELLIRYDVACEE